MTSHPTDPHADHDPLVVAALAAGDASGSDHARAEQLVATCADCAELLTDLQAIQAATAALPAPIRTRDFRLSEEDAARLRPSGWRSILAALRSPRLAFTQPLAVGMATLGLVGLLVASLPGPLLTSTSESGGSTEAAAPVAPGGTAEDLLKTEATVPAEDAVPADGAAQAQPSASPAPELAPGFPLVEAPGDRTVGESSADMAADTGQAVGDRDGTPSGELPWLSWLSAVLLVGGVGLFGLGRLARRAR